MLDSGSVGGIVFYKHHLYFFSYFSKNRSCRYALLMCSHNMYFFFFFSRNKKNVNFQASNSWLDKLIFTFYLSMDK